MNAVFSILLLAAILGFIVFLLSKKDQNRRSQYGPSGLSEFRTDLPLDDCFDRLDQHSPDDVFAYECHRLGLVVPQRTDGGARRYSLRDISRLAKAQQLSQEEGINLAGIARILSLDRKSVV